MELVRQNIKVGCDMPKCRNTADYAITAEGVAVWRKLNVCSECMAKLVQEYNKINLPQSPENHIKKARENQDARILGKK